MGYFLLIFLFCFITRIFSVELPCGKKQLGDRCIFDEDCSGTLDVCRNQICVCPNLDFEMYQLANKSTICRPAPNTADAECQNNCRPPLVCENGKCICWKAKQIGNKCVLECPSNEMLVGQSCEAVSQTVGGPCTDDSNCLAPFTICKDKKCDCVPGAKKTFAGCEATCPDGSKPSSVCRLKYLHDRKLRFASDQMDTCAKGERCVTFGKPSIGHCCKAYCPHGEPDLSKSCKRSDLTSSNSTGGCPSETHYCQTLESSGSRDRLCCPRPCREPTPFYWNGDCFPIGHLDDPCVFDEQCEGGAAMTCNNGRCQCKRGYSPHAFGAFPTCVRSDCPSTAVAVKNSCLSKSQLNQPCVDNAQCPKNARCDSGLCQCQCGFVVNPNLGVCFNPNDPLNLSPLICNLQTIFHPKATPDPRCATQGATPMK